MFGGTHMKWLAPSHDKVLSDVNSCLEKPLPTTIINIIIVYTLIASETELEERLLKCGYKKWKHYNRFGFIRTSQKLVSCLNHQGTVEKIYKNSKSKYFMLKTSALWYFVTTKKGSPMEVYVATSLQELFILPSMYMYVGKMGFIKKHSHILSNLQDWNKSLKQDVIDCLFDVNEDGRTGYSSSSDDETVNNN